MRIKRGTAFALLLAVGVGGLLTVARVVKATAPAVPTVTATTPASPHNDQNPEVKGTAPITELGTFGTQGTGNGQFDSVRGVGVAPGGDVYTADPFGTHIQRFSATGSFIARITNAGTGDGQTNGPYDVAVAPNGELFVADALNSRVQRLQADGTFIGKWGTAGTGDGQFASPVSGNGSPQALAIGPNGNVYVADSMNSRIQEFQPDGTFVRKWSTPNLVFGIAIDPSTGDVYTPTNGAIQQYSSSGSLIRQFGTVFNGRGAAFSGGYLYAISSSNHNISQFKSDGTFVRTYGQCCLYSSPNDIAFGNNGDAYVADTQNRTIHRLSVPSTVNLHFGGDCSGSVIASGPVDTFLGSGITVTVQTDQVTQIRAAGVNTASEVSGCSSAFPYTHDSTYDSTPPAAPTITDTDPDSPSNDNNPKVKGTAESGSTVKLYKTPDCSGSPAATGTESAFSGSGITLNVASDAITVIRATASDANNNVSACSSQFAYGEDSTGPTSAPTVSAVTPASPSSDNSPKVSGSVPNVFVSAWGGFGSGNGQFNTSQGIAQAPNGEIHVSDGQNKRIQVFSPTGTFVRSYGSAGSGNGQFGSEGPQDLAITSTGDVYVADRSGHRVQRFDPSGNFISAIGSFGSLDGQFIEPEGVGVAANGDVYVMDSGMGRIQRFTSAGVFVQKFGSNGFGAGQFNTASSTNRAHALDVAPNGDIWAADSGNNRIQHWTAGGLFLGTINTGTSTAPKGVDVSSAGDVFVVLTNSHQARQYDASGNLIASFGTGPGSSLGQFSSARGILAHGNGDVYVDDFTRVSRVTVPAGVRIHATSDCTDSALGSGTVQAFASPGITVTVANDSNSTFRAVSVDAAGNASPCSSSSVNYIEDSTGPTVSITASNPTSPSNVNTPQLSGTAEANSTVKLLTTSDCTGTIAGQGNAALFNGPGIQVSSVPPDQTTTFYAEGTDSVGNVGPCSSGFAYTEDSTGPDAPSFSGSTPASPANNNHPKLKGSTASGSVSITIYSSDNCTGTPVPGTAAAFEGAGITVDVVDDTNNTFTATATDAAGNPSVCSGTFTYIEDSTAAPIPTVTGTNPAGPKNNNNPNVIGNVGSTGNDATVEIYTNDLCSLSPVASGTEAVFESNGIQVTVGNDTVTSFYARAKDDAGNLSECSSTSATYVEDSTAPDAPTITSTDPASPSQSGAPKVIGNAETGSTVQIFVDGDAGPTGSAATFASSGIALSGLSGGSHELTAKATDAAGNESSASTGSIYVRDITAPDAPTITSTDPASPSNDPTPAVTGTAEMGSTVRIFVDGNLAASGSQADFANGAIFVPALSEGTHELVARAVDIAGNISDPSTQFPYAYDITSPSAPTITASDPASPSDDDRPRIKGSAPTDAVSVALYKSNDCSGIVAAEGSRSDFASPGLQIIVANDRITPITAEVNDAAGNTSACSSVFSYTERSPVTFSVADVPVAEGDSGSSVMTFNITASRADDAPMSVKAATANGTAIKPTDYLTFPLTKLTFAPGEVSKPVNVTINGDLSDEPDETFFLNLSAPVGGTLADAQAVGTITDDGDPLPSLSIGDVTKKEGDKTTTFAFTVSLSEVSGFDVTFTAATQDGTAIAPGDYIEIQPTEFTIPAGDKDASINVKVKVKGDGKKESAETFFVNLTDPMNASIADGQAVGTIKNDD